MTEPIVEAARHAVRAVAPNAAEVPYATRKPSSPSTMWKLFHYSVGGDYVVGIGTFTRHATLFFYRGTELADPDRLLEGRGKQFRSVTLRSPKDVERPGVQRLLHQAFQLAGA